MKLTTKARFAVSALLDLARQSGPAPMSLRQVGERLGVSLSYLEQLFVQLRRKGLVVSVRGPGGGYRLGRPAAEIRVADVVNAVDRQDDGEDGRVGLETALWDRLESHLMSFLEEVTLADMLAGQGSSQPVMPHAPLMRAGPERSPATVAATLAANDALASSARVHALPRR